MAAAEIAAGLRQQLEEIYFPLREIGQFEAKCDGSWSHQTILIIGDRAVQSVLLQILQKLETNMEGQKLSAVVWKGITYKDQQYKLWVHQLQDFEKGEAGSFCIEDFEVFKCDRSQYNYKVGVQIMVKMQ